ncbi:MAG TPA: tail fiber domain-containing protein [Candidatus Udaeobacter sp.]|nr:tail fiber domain-containing protein [Candidatus Udaeobacter sp.]
MKTMTPKALMLSLMVLLIACVAPVAQAVTPPPDGGYPGGNTAEGQNALLNLTSGGYNAAIGWMSLRSASIASFNTAVGAGTLALSNDIRNTAVGAGALLINHGGGLNTANGAFALLFNTVGSFNTASGDSALAGNIVGMDNTASGAAALVANTTGNENTADGRETLFHNTSGSDNTAVGYQAGLNATMGDGNVYIGAGMQGVAGEANHTYIRNVNTTSVSGGGTDNVTVNLTTGLLGHVTSSRRYKDDIKAIDTASEALFQLKPVSFRYKKEIDQSRSLNYGLIAEEVAEVDPNLAVRDRNGHIDSVRYSAINALLLNEFLKEHQAFVEEQKKVRKLEATLDAVSERLKEQEAKIQRVSDQLEVSRPLSQLVATGQ